MATSQREDEPSDNRSSNRQKRGLSFTGMLRDSLSLLVPSFVLDATTPKRRRVQDEVPASGSSIETVHNEIRQSGFGYSTPRAHQARSSTPTGIDGLSQQSEPQSNIPLYPSLATCQGNSEMIFSSEGSSNRQPTFTMQPNTSRCRDQPMSSHGASHGESIFTNPAKRTRLNDSHIPPSSQSGWTHTSGSSSSGSLLGETYHQSPFYPGRTSFGGASNYRRDTLRGRLNASKRPQTTVVPLRLNSVVSHRDHRETAAADDLSDVVSTASDSGPILSAATRRILRAMRHHTQSTKDANVNDGFGTTARSIRHQRHALWTSCVRRRGKSTSVPHAPPTMELRRFPQSASREANNMFSITSWPRDTIGVPPPASSSNTISKLDYRMFTDDLENSSADVGNQIQRRVGVLSSSYVFSSPAIRSQPSTRPPSNASAADVGRPNFTFQSPPSRSASSNALTDLVAAPTPNAMTETVPNLSFDRKTVNTFGSSTATQNSSVPKLDGNCSTPFQSKFSSISQSASSPMLFSGSRTLPEIHPPIDALPVSIPFTSQVSSASLAKRALPQDSWRCEACLAENPFLVTSCRVCQRAPSSGVVASQQKWHSRSTDNSSSKVDVNITSEKASDTDQVSLTKKDETGRTKQVKSSENPLFSLTQQSNKWRCETCLVENACNENKCVCCQSSKPNTQKTKSVPLATVTDTKQSTSSKWRCETCLVENPDSESKCVCCLSTRPNASKNTSAKSDNQSKVKEKWRCDTCLVENDQTVTKCVCCESPMPGPVQKAKSDQVATDKGWRCDTCLVENKASASKCVCCETPKVTKGKAKAKESQTVIQSGGLLSTWKTNSQQSFSFGKFGGSTNVKESINSVPEMGDKDQSTDKITSISSGNVLDGKNLVNSAMSSGPIKFGFGNSNAIGNLSTSSTENTIKFGSSNEKTATGGGFKFGLQNPLSADDKNVKNVSQASGSSFNFGNPVASAGINFGGTIDKSKFNFDVPKVNTETNPVPGKFSFTSTTSQGKSMSNTVSDGKSNLLPNNSVKLPGTNEEKRTPTLNSVPEAKTFSDGLKQGSFFKFGQTSGSESKVSSADSGKMKSGLGSETVKKIEFGITKDSGFKPTGNTNANFLFGQPQPGVSTGNQNPLSFLNQTSGVKETVSGVSGVGAFPLPKEPNNQPLFKSSNELKMNETAMMNGPPNQQVSNLFGLSRGNGQPPTSVDSVINPAPSTSIESLFSNSAPKMTFNKQDTVIPTLGSSSNFNDNKGIGTSLFGGIDSSKQKRLTGSMSSPALSTLPGGPTDSSNLLSDLNKKSTPIAFSFGKPGNTASGITNSSGFQATDKPPSNTSIFGSGNNEKPSIFGAQSQNVGSGSSIFSTVPVPAFGNVDNKSDSSGGFSNGPTIGSTPNIFAGSVDPNPGASLFGKADANVPTFGSNVPSQQPFVFGSSNNGGSSIISSNPQTQNAAPTVPNSFQFGQQSSNPSLFVFGNNANPPPNALGSNAGFGGTSANPFSSQPAVTGGINSARPKKNAHRRLRKQQ